MFMETCMLQFRSIAARLVLAISLIAAGTCALLGSLALYAQQRLTGLALEREMRLQYQSVIAAFDFEGRAASAVAVSLAGLPPVIDAVAREDRAALAALLAQSDAAARDQGIGTWSFTKPPGVTVFRAHRPDSFGDDVTSRRRMIAKLYRDNVTVTGIEPGQAALAIYGVTPLIKDGKTIGAFDVGIAFTSQFVDRIKERFNVDMAIHQIGDGKVATLGASFERKSLASAEELTRALAGEVVMRPDRLDGHAVEIYLGQLRNFAGEPIAVVELVKDITGFRQSAAEVRLVLIAVILVALAAAVAVALLVGRGMSLPIRRLKDVMARLSAGETDAEVPGRERADELGAMAQALDVFKDGMIEADRLRRQNEADRLAAEAERTRLRLKMADDFEGSVSRVVQSVSQSAGEMTNTAQALTASAGTTQTQSAAVAAASEQTSTNVQTVASAAEQLSASIAEIGRQASATSRVAGEVAEDGQHAESTIGNLTEAAARIGEIIQLIQGIAAQTNLLALNATIEAARAGDAGKGFAVVAAEVKQLANQTARATEEIQSQVAGIQAETGRAASAVRDMVARVTELRGVAASVSGAVEEQGAATEEIARNVQQAAAGTQEVSRTIATVSEAAQTTGSASARVLQAARDVADQSNRLKSEAERFIAEIRAG
jgi:methyl-accepting chemotaxis protein